VIARDIRFQNNSSGSDRSFSIGAAPPAIALSAITLNPASVRGSDPSQGTATLSGPAPAGGAVVVLSSDNPSAVTVPLSVTVPAGATSATFTVTTAQVTTYTTVSVTGTLGTSRSATLVVAPRPPSDTVTITRADYVASKTLLQVEATSTSTSAVLNAYVTATGRLIGKLTSAGAGKYTGKFTVTPNPQNITVSSSLGGSATRAVTTK
jgi:hypothetical protein